MKKIIKYFHEVCTDDVILENFRDDSFKKGYDFENHINTFLKEKLQSQKLFSK